MRFTMGHQTYDLATRCLVVAVLDADATPAPELSGRAMEMVGQGADIVELAVAAGGPERAREAVAALAGSVGAPVGIATPGVEVALAAIDAGAVLVTVGPGSIPPEVLRAAGPAEGVAVVVVEAPIDDRHEDVASRRSALVGMAHQAEAAGVAPERTVLDPALGRSAELLAQTRRFAELGYPLLLSGASGPAAVALGVTGGCRLIRTRDVRATRRVCDVLAAILEASP